MNTNKQFLPPTYLRNNYLQSFLASNKLRTVGTNSMVETEKEIIIDAGGGIRLQGFLSRQAKRESKGIVILLHGWEGSAKSAYVMGCGKYLHEMGYSVFRLNFRDHGDSHHLNEDVFWAIILDEVFEAVKQAAQMENGKPAFIIGFSLGGNFALRIAKKCKTETINHLKHIIAISPGLNPDASITAIDNERLIKWYFIKKWRRSLTKKQAMFPDIYQFGDLLTTYSVRKMTDIILERYGRYGETADYFNGYTIKDDYLKDVPVPTSIIVSEDDPIIPIKDFRKLELNDTTNLIIHKYGGHNGFISSIPFRCWYENKALELFRNHAS